MRFPILPAAPTIRSFGFMLPPSGLGGRIADKNIIEAVRVDNLCLPSLVLFERKSGC
jgi:hypothetical protein